MQIRSATLVCQSKCSILIEIAQLNLSSLFESLTMNHKLSLFNSAFKDLGSFSQNTSIHLVALKISIKVSTFKRSHKLKSLSLKSVEELKIH